MPLMYYTRKRLYSEKLVEFTSTIFDHYKIDGLAPYSEKKFIANYWLIRRGRLTHPRYFHNCFAWHDDTGREHSVFIPGNQDWREALCLARDNFESIIPSAIFFRLNNYESTYVYD